MKSALVTGASSGIGWHLSLELAKRGYTIIAVSNQPDNLQKLQTVIKEEYQTSCLTLDIDLTGPDAADRVYDFCQDNNVLPEVLVNNAGMLVMGEFASQERRRVDEIIQLHINVVTQLCYLFSKAMKELGRGYILNVASISAVMAFPVISLYGPSKTYIRAFSKAIRTELRVHNVVVTCLIPGATDTPLNDQLAADTDLAVKTGLMMQPEKVARKAIRGLFRGRAEVVPGIINRLALLLIPWVPRFLINYLYGSSLGKRLAHSKPKT